MNIQKALKGLVLILLILRVDVMALNKAPIDITQMDINSLSEALSLKIITSEELVNLYLDRINEYDKNYNAIITLNDKAVEEAKKLDIERNEGNIRSILHGIPIIVKDNIDVVGMPTTAGAKALKDNYPNSNAFVIQKLIDAGAIVIAKTNMSEFAFYASSSYSSYGNVNNAYNMDYTSYGSSGGTAVSVAASFAAAGLGTDTNSSVRLPASANNVIGLRPSLGLLSRTGVIPYDTERDTIGTITKTVNDSIILMNLMLGYDEKDYKSTNENRPDYLYNKKSLEGIVIGVPEKFINGSDNNGLPENKAAYSEVTKLMEQALNIMKENGAKVVYIDEYYTYTTDLWYSNSVSGYTFCDGFNKYIKNTTGTIRNFSQLVNSNNKVTAIDGYSSSCNTTRTFAYADSLKAAYHKYLNNIMDKDKIDVIVYPSSKNKLLKNNSEGIQNLSSHASSTINYPAIVVPLGFDSDGLPYGVEFMAPTNNEQLLFDIASVYESLNGNNITPEIAPALYTISEDVQNLIDNYKMVYNKLQLYPFEEKWIESVQKYFRSYSESKDVTEVAQSLHLKFVISQGLASILKVLILIIKWLLLITGISVALLLIRKVIRKSTRKRRKHRKK